MIITINFKTGKKLNKNTNERNAMYEFTTLLAQGLKILASVNITLIKSVESLCIVRKIRLRLPVSVE